MTFICSVLFRETEILRKIALSVNGRGNSYRKSVIYAPETKAELLYTVFIKLHVHGAVSRRVPLTTRVLKNDLELTSPLYSKPCQLVTELGMI
jgi:hypothetical protein